MYRAEIDLPTEEETRALAARIANGVHGVETILLSGPIGSGKSTLARAIIRALTSPDEEVPSPTFTLVQTYNTPNFDIWHADLYRLAEPAEVDELGLFDAMGRSLCLVEWPDRLGSDTPADALTIALALKPAGRGRTANLCSPEMVWDNKLALHHA